MDKTQLANLLNQYTAASAEEAAGVIDLCEQYPYSQVLHVLAARMSKDHGLKNQQALLQSAAVYSTDRSVLRQIMLGTPKAVTAIQQTVPATKTEIVTIATEANPALAPLADDVDYAEAVLKDLKRLNELKHNFESLINSFEHGIPTVAETPKTTEEALAEKPKKRGVGRPKKKAAVEAKADPFIEEIKASKKKIIPENIRTKEQIDIIDQFIKAQPSIVAKSRTEQAPGGDLTEIKSGEFADNVISETLVEILIRQGKKEKAIEVLKKLIWKFPQKKTYFAAQIEDLKK